MITFLLLLPAAPAWPAEMPKAQKSVIGHAAPVASLGIIEVIQKGGLLRKPGLDAVEKVVR